MKRLILLGLLTAAVVAQNAVAQNWYEKSFYLLHEDHHTSGQFEVGRDADAGEVSRLVGLSRPDMIQIHAKGNPGWTTYPTEIGHTPPKLARDVLAIWRDVARRDGYPFSVYYNIGRDGEIMHRHPAWNRVGPDGKPLDRALCYHSGVAEEYLWPMIREIMAGYKPDGFWFDGSCFTVRVCYCEKCVGRFKAEHGTEPPRSPGEPGWTAHQELQRQVYREFVHQTAAMIHGIDPECLVSVNWANSMRMPEKPDEGLDYLTGDIGNRVEGLSAEAHWYDAQRLPFDLMTQVCTLYEEQPTGAGKPRQRMAPKPAVQIEQEMAVIIANGGRYNAWDSPTPESGLTAERLEFLGRVVAPFLRARQEWCTGTERVADVSLLHSAASHYAANDTTTVCFNKSNNRIDGATNVLARHHLNYETLPDWRLWDQDIGSRLLIVEHPKVLTDRTVDSLIRFVHSGGNLLMTGMGVSRDRRFAEVFGVADVQGTSGAEPLVFTVHGVPHPLDHWLYRLRLTTAEQLLAVEDAAGQSQPILTGNRYGRGRAFYVPIPLLTKHGDNVVPESLLSMVLSAVLPPEDRLLTTDAPEHVEIVLRRKGDSHVVHLVNMAPGTRQVIHGGTRRYPLATDVPAVSGCRVSVKLPAGPARVVLEPQGVATDEWRFRDGRLIVDVPEFDVHQMIVIAAKKGGS